MPFLSEKKSSSSLTELLLESTTVYSSSRPTPHLPSSLLTPQRPLPVCLSPLATLCTLLMWNSPTWETQRPCIKHVIQCSHCYSGLTTFSFSIYTKYYLLWLFKPTERTFRSWALLWLLELRKSLRWDRKRERESVKWWQRGGQRVVSLNTEPHTHLHRHTHTHTQGLVRSPATSQQQGQAGCASQSQHYPSEQSISEEKQKNRGKRGAGKVKAERETLREDEEWKKERKQGSHLKPSPVGGLGILHLSPSLSTSSLSSSCCFCVVHPCWGPTRAPLPQPHIGSQ